jgi:hypothetical protein
VVGRSWKHISYKTGGLLLHCGRGCLMGVWWWSWLRWDLQCWFRRSNQSSPPVFYVVRPYPTFSTMPITRSQQIPVSFHKKNLRNLWHTKQEGNLRVTCQAPMLAWLLEYFEHPTIAEHELIQRQYLPWG